MQCSAMPCHAALLARFQPILEQARRWESKPEKNENRKGTRAAYCLLGQGKNAAFVNPIPSIKRHPNRPSPRTRGKKNRKSPDYEKLRQFSRKRSGHSAHSSRKQSTQVTSTIMSYLETTGTAAERLCAHAADAAAGLAHTGLALSAAPAGR